jgi:hypothetical protein
MKVTTADGTPVELETVTEANTLLLDEAAHWEAKGVEFACQCEADGRMAEYTITVPRTLSQLGLATLVATVPDLFTEGLATDLDFEETEAGLVIKVYPD